MLLELVFVSISLVIILIAAELFTNAVEWFGHRLGLAEGAVGSVLAAVGTAMPETMIPIIAILVTGTEGGHDIGVGAILGAPFLLSTAAFAVTGLGVLFFAKQRATGQNMHLDSVVIGRDIGYFFIVYVFAIGASFLPWQEAKYGVVAILLGLYGLYVYRTFSHVSEPAAAAAGHHDATGVALEAVETEDLAALKLHKWTGGSGSPPTVLIVLQFAAALGIMIGGALLFVANLESVAHRLGIPALPLALIIAPLASELPEKFNSIIWVSQGKDTLAMGNISGAMVFQSCIPVAIGVAFTDWVLSETALVSAAIALISTGIVYLSIKKRGYLSSFVLARAGLLWIGFVIYVVAKLVIEGGGDTAAH